MQIENQKYKDTVFRMLFNNKLNLLELYNAINGTNYTNPDDLTITTLSGETFLKVKNDLSFIINLELNIFEHQSTPCPNIPLRDLYYLAATLKEKFPTEKIYSPAMIKIPVPKFIVFYNGTSPMNDKVTYRLSDMFIKKDDNPSVELVVTVLNVNNGHNTGLMEACKTLKGYSIFVSKVRKYKQLVEDEYDLSHSTPLKLLADKRDVMNNLIKKAVTLAIDECVQENILKSFFEESREEIITVGVLEYSYERHMQMVQDESYNNGFNNGVNTGHNNGVKDTTELFSWLKANGRASDVLTAIDVPDYLSQLFTEYEAWKKEHNKQ